ncbi:MAG: protein transfer agent (GTA)-like protein [Caulobacteraceae bacterium]|nr:MAG: protein transfer agent (GTA)-like protein [Caulobacteraceae bacterium]
MADLIFTRAGGAFGSRIAPAAFQSWGRALGRTAGAYVGSRIEDALFARTRRIEGPRMAGLHIQSSEEGASIPLIHGRIRISGQVIWAARLRERRETVRSGGGKSGGGTRTTAYRYTLSFAVGLCEGPVARIERAWANGQPFDLADVAHRLHPGTEGQTPDPVIEAVEGADHAPAYRGLAYLVFEDLPLDDFGDVLPQLSFEVVRGPAADGERLETMARGVCLIPGSGEFACATTPVRRVIAAGQETSENVHADPDRANILVSLDQLQADMPRVETVSLVSSWFGDDLRCGVCTIRPGVEIAAKETRPLVWRAGGVERAGARVVSQIDGAPAFGGTPADESIVQAIGDLKARGLRVGLNPFLLMDVPPDNALPDPHGGATQPAFPWRGRITCTPAPGVAGTVDKTAAATAQVAAFFGAETDWGYRRFILHHAHLAVLAGGVDFFLIGSELRGLTIVRDSATHFPAVQALRALAAHVRAILGPSTKITYAADWSEYGGHRPADGSGDVFFHLDPLWADTAIDAIGIDWYPPLTDWRDGDTHADRALATRIHDPAYLAARIEAGEIFDWYYASDADRSAQIRTPITDGAYGKPWIYRAKDVRRFWSEAHHDRPGGVESATPTAWIPQSKPVWFLELGAPAIDKGSNAPNLFIDARSGESAAPPFSDRARDDLIQRRTLEAYLSYWADDARNPDSNVYAGRMFDLDHMCLWAWDARPFPQFPARTDIWSDGASWRLGHWLNGRAGAASLAETVEDICARAGMTDVDVSDLGGVVTGMAVDSPTTARAALAPLQAAYRFDVREHEGRLVFAHGEDAPVAALGPDDLVDADPRIWLARADIAARPVEARVRFIDGAQSYEIGAASARQKDAAGEGVIDLDAPLVMDDGQAAALVENLLSDALAAAETADIAVPPSRLDLEPGDRLDLSALGAGPGAFRIVRIEDEGVRKLSLVRDASGHRLGSAGAAIGAAPARPVASRPQFFFLDLPPLPGREDDDRPLAAVAATPWTGPVRIHAGAARNTAASRAIALAPAEIGELVDALWPGPVGRWDRAGVMRVRMPGVALSSVTDAALFRRRQQLGGP